MRKYDDKVASALVIVEDALHSFVVLRNHPNGVTDDQTTQLLDAHAGDYGFKDYKHERAVIANALKTDGSVRTNSRREFFDFLNGLLEASNIPFEFKVEKITRTHKPTMFNTSDIRDLLDGKVVTARSEDDSNPRYFRLVETDALGKSLASTAKTNPSGSPKPIPGGTVTLPMVSSTAPGKVTPQIVTPTPKVKKLAVATPVAEAE